MVATIMAPSSPPPKDTPKERNRKPPSNAPSTPTMMSPMTPKPPPFINCPANHPATNPIKINKMNSMTSSSHERLYNTALPGKLTPRWCCKKEENVNSKDLPLQCSLLIPATSLQTCSSADVPSSAALHAHA